MFVCDILLYGEGQGPGLHGSVLCVGHVTSACNHKYTACSRNIWTGFFMRPVACLNLVFVYLNIVDGLMT